MNIAMTASQQGHGFKVCITVASVDHEERVRRQLAEASSTANLRHRVSGVLLDSSGRRLVIYVAVENMNEVDAQAALENFLRMLKNGGRITHEKLASLEEAFPRLRPTLAQGG